MELWDIKANALRLMFADSDMMFEKTDFETGVVYENGNTREKLVRMNDSIERAIDLYYHYCGQYNGQEVRTCSSVRKQGDYVLFSFLINEEDRVYEGLPQNFGVPTRVDLLGIKDKKMGMRNLYYRYDHIKKELLIKFNANELSRFGSLEELASKMEFLVYFSYEKLNIPYDADELTFDLDTIYIPSDVQRAIPKYIKGEIYEEDEYAMAQNSKQEYIQFLVSYKRKFSNVQTKVKSIHKRG